MGDLEKAALTDKNPRVAAAKLKEAIENGETNSPQIYMTCGLQDSLITANHSFRDYLLECGLPVTYTESDGIHDWNFWNEQIQNVLN